MPTPPGCIPLSEFFHQLVRAQNIESTVLSLPLIYTMRYFLRQPQFFFRRSRLFFREAAFFSGGEGCEWRAQRATVGESGDKAENEFSGFIPLVVSRKGLSPHIPAPRLFVHFHTTMPKSPSNPSSIHQVESIQSVGSVGSVGSMASIHPKKSKIPYWYCLQCTPSLTLPPSSLKC